MQSEGSAFTKRPIKNLKTFSDRLTRALRVRDRVVPKEQAKLHLLVLDEEESILFCMSEYFSQHGFMVDTARELEEAAKLIATTTYQVVIQDLRLGFTPDAGLDIINLVHQRHPETRIVVFTSYSSDEIEGEARRSGADVFLHKPKPLSQVAQIVQRLIESPRKKPARSDQ